MQGRHLLTTMRNSEWPDVDADGAEIGIAGAGEEADDAAVVLDGNAEAVPARCVHASKRSMASAVGDELCRCGRSRIRTPRELPSRTPTGQDLSACVPEMHGARMAINKI